MNNKELLELVAKGVEQNDDDMDAICLEVPRLVRDYEALREALSDTQFMFACVVAERGILTIDKGTMVRLQKNPTLVRVDGEARVVFTIDRTALVPEKESP